MRVLVAVANYGTGNRRYLDRLLAEYKSMPWEVDIVVLSNIPKDLHQAVEVRVGLPDKNPWSLPFAHKALFMERRNDYDLFIYSEDDTLVRVSNIEAFLAATRVLKANEIAGFMRTEVDGAGVVYVSTVHGSFRWDCGGMVKRGEELFVPFTNEHSACYMMTRDQLRAAIESGGFLLKPYEGKYDMLCTAATDVYTRCGFKRYICVSRLSGFLLPHLPNKYVGKMGVPLAELQAQVETLQRLSVSDGWRGPLFAVERDEGRSIWSKSLYDVIDVEAVNLIPSTAKTALFVGSGWGATEAAVSSSGLDVTALPVDPVFGDALRRRGIRTVELPFKEAIGQLPREHFDVVVALDILQLADNPAECLRLLRPLLSRDKGRFILSIPQTHNVAEPMKVIRRFAESQSARPPWTGARQIKRWVAEAGLSVCDLVPLSGPKRETISRMSVGILKNVLAHRFLLRARARTPALEDVAI